MILYKTAQGPVIEEGGRYFSVPRARWDALLNDDDLLGLLQRVVATGLPFATRAAPLAPLAPLAPIGTQEVWAAGVTYLRSRTARKHESGDTGGAIFYDRVYEAVRPELFFKATPHRVAGPGTAMRLRNDSTWMVPEAELTLVINKKGVIIGYTIGNDLSCRDIEGENPLYLPQGKIFDGSAALGPGILVTDTPLPRQTEIRLSILRADKEVMSGATTLQHLKRELPSLVEFLYRACSFPTGCFLMTGTGIVPPDDFSLKPGDQMRITIDPIGTLVNTIRQ